jgi:hypothetical protein
MGDVFVHDIHYNFEQEYFSNKKQILMGYYADLEVERSIEGDYENRTYTEKGAIRVTNTFTKRI